MLNYGDGNDFEIELDSFFVEFMNGQKSMGNLYYEVNNGTMLVDFINGFELHDFIQVLNMALDSDLYGINVSGEEEFLLYFRT